MIADDRSYSLRSSVYADSSGPGRGPTPPHCDSASIAMDSRGAVMVEYVIALAVATIAAVIAMYSLGYDLATFYLWAQAILLWPV